MSNSLTSLVPVFNGTNYMAWGPAMKNYLLSQGQWRNTIVKPLPIERYPQVEIQTKQSNNTTVTTLTDDKSKGPLNQEEIDQWIDNNDKARGNIILRLHNIIAEKFYIEEHASVIWDTLEKDYGKPGITAIFQEFTGSMTTTIPDNSDPSFTLKKIISHFLWMSTANCIIPEHLKVMTIISKMPQSMTALIQLVCQTDDITLLDCDKIKRMISHSWEQRVSSCSTRPPQQAAKKISAIQHSGTPPSFVQQQEEPREQGQGSQGNWHGGQGGRGHGGMYRGTRTGKNKNQQQQQEQARPVDECDCAASPTPSFQFGEITSPLIVPPQLPRSVYLNFANTLSLANRLGVKASTETVKCLEISERALEKKKLTCPPKHPRVNRDEEVSLYWTSDEDVDMFLADSAGPSTSSRYTLIASPLEATNLPTGYNAHTKPAVVNTTTYAAPNMNEVEISCCSILCELDAKEYMNKVEWIVVGVCADLLLSYQRNSVGVFGGGNGGDEGCSGWFCREEGRMGRTIVGGDRLEVVVIELVEVEKQFHQIALQVVVELMERLTEFDGDLWC